MADDDDEGCAAQLRKVRSAVINYGWSFIGIAFAFVAYDVSRKLAPSKDAKNSVNEIYVNMWFGKRPYIDVVLKLCTVIAVVRFTIELLSILLHKSASYKMLKFLSIFSAITIIVILLPVVTAGFVVYSSLGKVDSKYIDGKFFHVFQDYDELSKTKDCSTLEDLNDKQEKIDLIQLDYSCCGLNKPDDWDGWRGDLTDVICPNSTIWRLQWWSNRTNAESGTTVSINDTVSSAATFKPRNPANSSDYPYSCCPKMHSDNCHRVHAFRNPCKRTIVELLSRCILYACILLLVAGIFGMVGASRFFYTSRQGITRRKLYKAWLAQKGIKEEDDPADD